MDLFEDETEADDPTLVGENCHIVAESDEGPRGDPTLPIESRNTYANLILLCRNHHKIIDAQELTYTVKLLREWKIDHEAWVRSHLSFDPEAQLNDEHWASIVDKWENLANVGSWDSWTSRLLSGGQPSLAADIDKDLAALRLELLAQVWPDNYVDLQEAFENFRRVIIDLQDLFRSRAETAYEGLMITSKFYNLTEWDEARYATLSGEYDYHVDLLQDLTLEATRAANLIADRIRKNLRRSYRLLEGRLAVTYGPTERFQFHTLVVQYSSDERQIQYPYPGIEKFKTITLERDVSFVRSSNP